MIVYIRKKKLLNRVLELEQQVDEPSGSFGLFGQVMTHFTEEGERVVKVALDAFNAEECVKLNEIIKANQERLKNEKQESESNQKSTD